MLLRRGSKDPVTLIDNILLAAERGGALTRQLLSLARNRPINREVVSLATHIPTMTAMLCSSLRGDIDLQLSVDPEIRPVEVDVSELEIALLNIALNARDAMPTGGCFTIDVRNLKLASLPSSLPASPHGFIAIAAYDTGIGMPPDVIAKALDPFFTTKKPGYGTGLGLSQVSGFAEGSGGTIQIKSAPSQGTVITIILPITDKPIESPNPRPEERTEPLQGQLLLVDDNLEVMSVIVKMTTAMGLNVEHTNMPTVALERITSRPERYKIVLADIVMPGMNGVDLARDIRAICPTMPIILMSGYNDLPPPPGFRVLSKPIRYGILYDAIRDSLGSSSS